MTGEQMRTTTKTKTVATENSLERKPVAGLIRVSTDDQAAEGRFGIPAQKDAILMIAQLNDLHVAYWFQIEGVSGSVVMHSPKMQELFALVRAGLISGIVVKEDSRLMRKLDSSVIDLLAAHKVLIYTPGNTLDFSDPDQRMIGEIKYSVAGRETSVIASRLGAAKIAKMRRGQWHCGRKAVPFGLDLYKDGKGKGAADRLRVNDEIEKVKNLFREFIDAGGFASFADLARMTGVPYTNVEYVLRNELYTGYHVKRYKVGSPSAGKLKDERWPDGTLRYQRRVELPAEEWERVKMLEDAPISEKTFQQAQRLLALRKEMRIKTKSGSVDPYQYRGFLKCLECGRRVITLTHTGSEPKQKGGKKFRREYYVCIGTHGKPGTPGGAKTVWAIKPGTCITKRMRREVVEDLLDAKIREQIADPLFFEKVMAAQLDDDTPAIEDQIEQLKAQIEEAEHAIKVNYRQHLRRKIDEPTFDEVDRELRLEVAALESKLEKIRPNLARLTPEDWKNVARQFVRWEKRTKDGAQLTAAEKRSILSSLGIVFELAGYPTMKYHETEIRIKRFSINIQAAKADSNDKGDEGDDSVASGALVAIPSRLYSGQDNNKLAMSFPL
jgi:DNA invertase Pin-like site-specific DNA recombinase